MTLEQVEALSRALWSQADALKERNEKLEKVVAAAKLWLAVADTYAKHRDDPDRSVYKVDYMRGREIFRDALADLEQP